MTVMICALLDIMALVRDWKLSFNCLSIATQYHHNLRNMEVMLY